MMKLTCLAITCIAAIASAAPTLTEWAVIQVRLADGSLRFQPVKVGSFPEGTNTDSKIKGLAATVKVATFIPPESDNERLCAAVPENPSQTIFQGFDDSAELAIDPDGRPRRILYFNCVKFPLENVTLSAARQSAPLMFGANGWE